MVKWKDVVRLWLCKNNLNSFFQNGENNSLYKSYGDFLWLVFLLKFKRNSFYI